MAQKPKTKKEVMAMKRAYLKTLSLSMAAKVVGCHPTTVARWRDRQGWVGPAKLKFRSDSAPAPTLTADIAMRLVNGWRLHMQDKDMCSVVGITVGQLKMWLNRNTQVTIMQKVTQVGADGKPLQSEDGKVLTKQVSETIGLRDLRAREWAGLELRYMQKQAMIEEQAFAKGDLALAAKQGQWILVARLREKFGSDAVFNIAMLQQQAQGQGMTLDDLDLTDEQKRMLLKKIRERKQIEGGVE